jgi:hypothetical protein
MEAAPGGTPRSVATRRGAPSAVGEHGLSRGNLILWAHPGPHIFTMRAPSGNHKGSHVTVPQVHGLFCNASAKYAQRSARLSHLPWARQS